MSNWIGTIIVPTIKEANHQELNLCGLSESDLQVLRKQDPFMYHSIPSVYKATLTLQAADNVKTISTQASSIVTRKSRVSTECHASLLMEDLFDDEEVLNNDVEAFEFPVELALLRSALNDRLYGGNVFDNDQQPEQ
jgi:hypothetical protein